MIWSVALTSACPTILVTHAWLILIDPLNLVSNVGSKSQIKEVKWIVSDSLDGLVNHAKFEIKYESSKKV
jgi:hypothetical protein